VSPFCRIDLPTLLIGEPFKKGLQRYNPFLQE
jgi:hypothetical protein